MNSNWRYIERFITRSYERSIDHWILSDKKYVIPKHALHNYLEKVLSISMSDFIDYIRYHRGNVNDDQLTQSSNFDACSSEMCKVLDSHGNPGMRYVDIGKLFPQYIKQRNETAYRKYGENQVKTSAQLGLTFEYYDYWYLTCIGYIYNELEERQQKSLLARTVLRVPLYQDILLCLLNEDVHLDNYMKNIAPSTQGRRAGSIIRLLNCCLNECRIEGIYYHNLYYPVYQSKTKQIRKDILLGTFPMKYVFPKEEMSKAAETENS